MYVVNLKTLATTMQLFQCCGHIVSAHYDDKMYKTLLFISGTAKTSRSAESCGRREGQAGTLGGGGGDIENRQLLRDKQEQRPPRRVSTPYQSALSNI